MSYQSGPSHLPGQGGRRTQCPRPHVDVVLPDPMGWKRSLGNSHLQNATSSLSAAVGQETILAMPGRALPYFCTKQLLRFCGGLTAGHEGLLGGGKAREPPLLDASRVHHCPCWLLQAWGGRATILCRGEN